MIELLIILNVVITLIFFWFIWKIKVSFTSVFLSTFIIFYVIGFLVIGFNPEGPIWDYLEPDMRRIFVFPFGTGEPQIYFITMVNLSLLIGVMWGFVSAPKTTLLTTGLAPITKKNKDLLVPLAWYFFLFSLCYMMVRFYFVPDLPLYRLMVEGGRTRLLSDAWLANKDVPWIFLPSIYMQFLQFFLPISSFLFYSNYDLKKTRSTFVVFVFSLVVNFFSFLFILKRSPFIMFGVSVMLLPLIYKHRMRFNNIPVLVCGLSLIIFGIFSMTGIQMVENHKAYLSSAPIAKTGTTVSFKLLSDFDYSAKSFKSSKVPLDFSKDMEKIIKDYNDRHYGPVSPLHKGIIAESICRIFTGEMMASFVIVGNPELMEYVRNSHPFHTYIQKVLGYKTRNIYQAILSILAGQYCVGSTTISTFLEIFIFLGYYSILVYVAIGFLLIRVDIFIVNRLDQSFAPVLVLLMLVVAQAPLKGLMTTIFTVGGVSCLGLFFVFYLYFLKRFYKFLPHRFITTLKMKRALNFITIFDKINTLNFGKQ